MKKFIFAIFMTGLGLQAVQAASAQQYVETVGKISDHYKQDTRKFFNTLDPMQKGFSAEQQTRFCRILTKYVNDLYQAADTNRAYLDSKYANLTKKDVVAQVLSSKEMQILKNYNVQCDFN